jgi:ferredoxin-NADP reductase
MAKLTSRQEVAERTMAFRFEKPAGWTFEAGQFVDLTLLNPPETDAEGNTRGFSLASAPFEDTIMVATRMRDTAFKRALRTLPLGTEVRVEGPFGDLRLHNNAARPAIVLSGGIGITPFRSIFFRAAKMKLPHRIYFFYSNRRPEDAPFLEEMQMLEHENPNFKFVPTMTAMDRSRRPWRGETGRIDRAMLAKYLGGVASGIYYMTGPPAMVKGLRMVLKAADVDDDDIRTEEFAGY